MLIEIRFHGRGGQGAVTAATLLVKAAFNDGYYGQAFPFFGAERRGAPVTAFARLSDEEIRIHSQIYKPDVVVVLDPKIMDIINVTDGLKENGVIVANTSKKPSELEYSKRFRVATINATKIALDLNLVVAGWPVVNTAILGALGRVIKIIKPETLYESIKRYWAGKIGELNAEAAKIAYKEVVLGD